MIGEGKIDKMRKHVLKIVQILFLCVFLLVMIFPQTNFINKISNDEKIEQVAGDKETAKAATIDPTNTGASSAGDTEKGGIALLDANTSFSLKNGTLTQKSKKYGGAFFVSSGATLTMSGGTISGCSATFGGGIYVQSGGTLTITGGTITGCTAKYGAAIFVEKGANFSCSSSQINKNDIVDMNNPYILENVPSDVSVLRGTKSLFTGDAIFMGESLQILFENDYYIESKITGATQINKTRNYTVNDNVNIQETTKIAATMDKLRFSLQDSSYYYYNAMQKDDTVSGEIIIPTYHENCEVGRIGSYGFQDNAAITSVKLPPTIRNIGYWSFGHCSGILSINLPEGLESIDRDAFAYCSSLTSLTIPGTVKSIGESAFFECKKITTLTLKEGVTSIPKMAFFYCYSLRTVYFPSSLQEIKDSAFWYCNFRTLTLPSGLTTLEDYAFSYCSELTSVTIPASLTSIGIAPFSHSLRLLSSIVVDKGNKVYTSRGFGTSSSVECNVIAEISSKKLIQGCTTSTLTSGITSIEESAFSGCYYSQFTTLTIPDTVKTIGPSAFYECSSIKSVIIGSGVTSIEDRAFYGCTSLNEVVISSSTIFRSLDSTASSNGYLLNYINSRGTVKVLATISGTNEYLTSSFTKGSTQETINNKKYNVYYKK